MIKKEGKNYALKKTFGVKQTKITNKKKKIDPVKEALKIIFSYILLGFLWVLLSDKVLSALVKDIDILNVLQLYKGWFYVGMTAVVFYIIILDKLKLFDRALDKSREAFEKLKISHEELISLETELKDRNERLNKSQTELIASNRRFELVVDGANDGIWDWDVINKKYFFSICFKKEFGYSSYDIDSSSGAWMDMIHPSDVPHVMDTLEEYMKTRSGIYQNTYRIKAKDGEYRWVLSRGKGEWDENGVVCLAGSHTDITEQKIMEKNSIILHTMIH